MTVQEDRDGVHLSAEAFTRALDEHRHELTIHCYRMLGSMQDAEDALQETFLRAWSRLVTYRADAPLRAWLYQIATNYCLDLLRHRRHEAVHLDPDRDITNPEGGVAFALETTIEGLRTVEPITSAMLPPADPETRAIQRESVSMAFMSVLHALSPRQRAILILRDVLEWQAKEVAEFVQTTEAGVHSTLLRARKALASAHLPAPSSPTAVTHLLNQYVDAWEQQNIEGLIRLLHQEAMLTMPPFPMWSAGLANVEAMLRGAIFAHRGQWRLRPMEANGQPAYALYFLAEGEGDFQFIALQVVTILEQRIARLDNFVVGNTHLVTDSVPALWLRNFTLPPP